MKKDKKPDFHYIIPLFIVQRPRIILAVQRGPLSHFVDCWRMVLMGPRVVHSVGPLPC